ncbi:hypothetical protein [Thermococcus stetteri]|uniref:hypothetical protein n=1 Tax=Thermococcus stetteri TaxID=49900 RepID=UPI001AE10737|nr:hypothetical protein [Thermococcus stetteri]MBP1911452.1 hypothetical protein [Thermococcus stetteri]
MRKSSMVLALVLILVLGVISSGCLGGNNIKEKASSAMESYTEGESSSQSEGSSGEAGGNGGGEEATATTWGIPWDAYNPVKIGGVPYYITGIEYTFTIKTPDGERSFSIIKKRGYVKAHVYADENGEKKDLGEFNLFAYYGRITQLNNESAEPFEYVVMVKERSKDTDEYFLEPMPNFGALGTGNTVVAEAKSGGAYFYWSNPAAVGQYSELPYTEGDVNEVFGEIGGYLFQGWVAMMGSGAWSGLEGHDLTKADEYSFIFMGIGYHYKIDPDGTVTFDGKSFRVSNIEWSYSLGGVSGQGRATIAPELPVPVETEGTFVSMASGVKTYSKLKVEDVKFSRELSGMSVSIGKPTSEGTSTETESWTETETQTQQESSQNWKRAWDASEPIKIGGEEYTVREVTYDITYRTPGGEVHYMMERGYNETDNGYVAYAVVRMDDGSTYTFEVHTENIEEYTGWALWMPSVFQLIESGSSGESYTVQGPSCSYTFGESGISGDMYCGNEITQSPFDLIWDAYNGFSGGIYGDVVDVADLSSNGNGYTVRRDGTVNLGGMEFDLYNVTWSGSLMGASPANGYTLLAAELPFPVEIVASISGMEGGAMYLKVKITDIKIATSG